MMTWDAYLRCWETHAKLGAHKRRFESACDQSQRGAAIGGRMFGALSGGKDGCALACVLKAAGLQDVPLVHCHTDLNTPGMEQCALATAELLDMDLEIVEPEKDIWDWLREWPQEYSLREPQHHLEFVKLFASGNMLVAYQYANGFNGSFTGMRAEESRGRRMNRIMRGHMYQLTKDASWICQPIVDWTARDVFACLVQHGAPIHDYYRLALERFGVDPESPSSRVDCMIPDETVVQWPALMPLKELYPELYRRVVNLRPELAT